VRRDAPAARRDEARVLHVHDGAWPQDAGKAPERDVLDVPDDGDARGGHGTLR
jgi:hypothetical protein